MTKERKSRDRKERGGGRRLSSCLLMLLVVTAIIVTVARWTMESGAHKSLLNWVNKRIDEIQSYPSPTPFPPLERHGEPSTQPAKETPTAGVDDILREDGILRAKSAVFCLHAEPPTGDVSQNGEVISRTTKNGGAFLVGEDEYTWYLMTAFHVVEGAELLVQENDGDTMYPASLVSQRSEKDAAILAVSKRAPFSGQPLQIGNEPKIGAACVVLRACGSSAWKSTVAQFVGRPAGVASAVDRVLGERGRDMKWAVVSHALGRGSSGLPVLSPSGTVVGMVVAGVDSNPAKGTVILGAGEITGVLRALGVPGRP